MVEDDEAPATTGEEEDEEEEVSDAEKLAIVQHLLLNAPPGQFDEVKRDALALVPETVVSPAMLAGIARAYNTAQLRVLPTPDGKLVLCDAGETSPTRYVEPSSGATYEVDHVALTADKVDAADAAAGSLIAERRAGVAAALESYVKRVYADAPGTACAAYAVDDATLKLVVSGAAINLRNYWSGNWRSTWTVALAEGPTIEGTLKVRAHYFEDGNVQLQTSKAVASKPLAVSDDASPQQLGEAVVAVVAEAETALQRGLEDMYANMSHETFKAMRRTMPITRTKMKWNINEIALNRNLRK